MQYVAASIIRSKPNLSLLAVALLALNSMIDLFEGNPNSKLHDCLYMLAADDQSKL